MWALENWSPSPVPRKCSLKHPEGTILQPRWVKIEKMVPRGGRTRDTDILRPMTGPTTLQGGCWRAWGSRARPPALGGVRWEIGPVSTWFKRKHPVHVRGSRIWTQPEVWDEWLSWGWPCYRPGYCRQTRKEAMLVSLQTQTCVNGDRVGHADAEASPTENTKRVKPRALQWERRPAPLQHIQRRDALSDGHHHKVYKRQTQERVWRKGNPATLLVGM